ncbi:MAG TPA: lytic transglycosylase domain-containing protein [Castellaniella sp.]|uniref:lytic transglycosylase domain-containing protein n=1 Tax=Castellaniella sp. TaxID=1955812 RepID=UPI002EFEC0E2
MLAELAALALACAPNIHPVTLEALIRHESGTRQYAIGVNRKDKALSRQPHDLETASRAAERLIAEGIDFDAGLGQINVRNWGWLGLTSTTVFDPCRNLAAAQTVLSDCYARALNGYRDQQQALRAALSCYNTGNFTKGFANGYVRKVVAQAAVQVPALKPVVHPGDPLVDSVATPEPGTVTSHPAVTATGNDPGIPGRSPKQQGVSPETSPQGSPDGFTAHPAADGFTQPAR